MKVTTREHLLFCTTCLFSFYYRRRSLSSGMHKVGGGVSGVRRLPKCDTFMDRISFICETSFLLCVCCSSSHHSPLLLLCFFSLRVACFYCFARFFFFGPAPSNRSTPTLPNQRLPPEHVGRHSGGFCVSPQLANKKRPPLMKTISVLRPANRMTVT